MSRLPRSVLLSIPDFALYNPTIEAVRPRTVDPHSRVKFSPLRAFNQPTERPPTGVLWWENVSVMISFSSGKE